MFQSTINDIRLLRARLRAEQTRWEHLRETLQIQLLDLELACDHTLANGASAYNGYGDQCQICLN